MDDRQMELRESTRIQIEEARDMASKLNKTEIYNQLCESGASARNRGCWHCRCMCTQGMAYHIKLGHDIELHYSYPYAVAVQEMEDD